VRRILVGAFGVVAAIAGCEGGALQPGGVTSGSAGSPGAGAGSAAAGGSGGDIVGTGSGGDIVGSGSGGASQPTCAPISEAAGVLHPCGRTFSLAFHRDGSMLATGTVGARPTAHLWRLDNGTLIRDVDAAGGTTYDVEFSPGGGILATAGGYQETGGTLHTLPEIVKLWNVADGSLLLAIPAHCGSYASTASFSHDGTLLVTAGEQGPVEIWRVSDGALVTSIQYPTSVHNAHFSPDDARIVGGGVDRRATVWDVATGAWLMTLTGTADEMADAVFSPDGTEIATTAANNAIAVWSAKTGAVRQTMPGHATYVSHVIWAGTDRLISNDWGGTVNEWTRGANGDFALSRSWTTGGQSLGIALSADQKALVAGGADSATGAEGFAFLPF
jgi:WD40 repeat protein